jgi:nitrite reductase/ring-hydroxylating ferredoxin subunit
MNSSVPASALWYAVCGVNAIPNRRAKAFQLLRRDEDGSIKTWSIFILRWGSQYFGYLNVCPHQGDNLDWERNQFLDPSGLRLLCGKHGALFEIGTGRCVDGPCVGEGLTVVPVQIIDDEVCVSGVELVEEDEQPLAGEEPSIEREEPAAGIDKKPSLVVNKASSLPESPTS